MLFPQGCRPSQAKVKRAVARLPDVAISHDPAKGARLRLVDSDGLHGEQSAEQQSWLELLFEGMTFDVTGLAPGPTCPLPAIDAIFDFRPSYPIAQADSIQIVPGGHLAGGANLLPVLRGMISIACALVGELKSLEAVAWPPARSVMGMRYFESVATAWLEGGAFPAIGFVAFRKPAEGGVESVGLSYLTGQELFVDTSVTRDKVEATRLAVRLINHLVHSDPIRKAEQFAASDGRLLTIEPCRGGKVARVIEC